MTTDLDSFDPFDPATLQCPFPHYAGMRDERPVMFVEALRTYVVTRHDLVLGILRDPQCTRRCSAAPACRWGRSGASG